MSKPRPGEVFKYPFLWKRQEIDGETEGRKPRPVCLAITMANADGDTVIFIVPISTLPPNDGRIAIQVPLIEAKRAGLSTGKQCWVILDEFNYDVFERSYVFEDRTPIGAFSPRFTSELQRILIATLRKGTITSVDRLH